MNELTITGPADKVSAWAELHTTKYETSTSVLDFNKSVPEPLDENGNSNVNWQYDNWGTKWGACDTCYLYFNEGHVTIAFDTAWGPADTWIHTMSDMFPDLEFTCRYAEPGYLRYNMRGSNHTLWSLNCISGSTSFLHKEIYVS